MDKSKIYMALFSAKAAELYGTAFYKNAEGKEIEVTAVMPLGTEKEYNWQDTVNRGKVVEWVRDGRKGSHEIITLDAPLSY